MERVRKKKRKKYYYVAVGNTYRCTILATSAIEALQMYAQTCSENIQVALQEANVAVSSIYAKLPNGAIVHVALA
jgi:REP element-mobilizing transposase RayT